MRKYAILVAALCLAGLMAAGCSSSPSSSSADNTLTVVGYKGGGTEIANMPEINAEFQKAYPNVKLTYKFIPYADYYSGYLNPRFAAGNAPDVIMTDKVGLELYGPKGYLMNLSSQPWVRQMNPQLKPFNSLNGKTYLLNSEVIPVSLFTNLDLLHQAAITQVPQTWPEFIADLQTLKAKNIGGLLLANKGGWTAEQLALNLGANLIPPTWAPAYDSGHSHWAPTWAPVIDRLKQLLGSGLVNNQLMLGLDPNINGIPLFEQGKYAFTIQGAWNLAEFAKNATFHFSMDPFPGGDAGTQPKSFVYIGTGWGINAATPHKTAAEEYVNFMSQKEAETQYLEGEAAFSSLTNIPSPLIPDATPITSSYNSGNTSPSDIEVLNFPQGEPQLQNAIEQIMTNPDVSTDSILQELDTNVPATPES